MLKKCTAFLALTALATLTPVASGAMLDFETADQFENNFRKVFGTATAIQTSNGADNDFVSIGNGTSFIAFYDTTPLDPGTGSGTGADAFTGPLTIQTDVRFPNSGNSFGIFLINADDQSQSHLVLFNYNNRIRIFPAANPDPAANSLGTPIYDTEFPDSNINNTAWSTLTVDYTVNAENEPVISVTMGNLATGPITLENVTAFDSVSVGIRVSPPGNATNIVIELDNFSIVPEPSALALTSLAGGLLLSRRRRS